MPYGPSTVKVTAQLFCMKIRRYGRKVCSRTNQFFLKYTWVRGEPNYVLMAY